MSVRARVRARDQLHHLDSADAHVAPDSLEAGLRAHKLLSAFIALLACELIFVTVDGSSNVD